MSERKTYTLQLDGGHHRPGLGVYELDPANLEDALYGTLVAVVHAQQSPMPEEFEALVEAHAAAVATDNAARTEASKARWAAEAAAEQAYWDRLIDYV